MQPSLELQKATCEDVGKVFKLHLDNLSLNELYASNEFQRVARRVRKEFPEATNAEILKVILEQYSEQLKRI